MYYEKLPSVVQPKVVERHFHDLLQRYGHVVAVDLTNKVYSFLLILGSLS